MVLIHKIHKSYLRLWDIATSILILSLSVSGGQNTCVNQQVEQNAIRWVQPSGIARWHPRPDRRQSKHTTLMREVAMNKISLMALVLKEKQTNYLLHLIASLSNKGKLKTKSGAVWDTIITDNKAGMSGNDCFACSMLVGVLVIALLPSQNATRWTSKPLLE